METRIHDFRALQCKPPMNAWLQCSPSSLWSRLISSCSATEYLFPCYIHWVGAAVQSQKTCTLQVSIDCLWDRLQQTYLFICWLFENLYEWFQGFAVQATPTKSNSFYVLVKPVRVAVQSKGACMLQSSMTGLWNRQPTTCLCIVCDQSIFCHS